MAVRDLPLGPRLDLWLDRLDAEGFRIGMRERLVIQNFLARLAVTGDLPADPARALEQIAPLVCTTPASQRHYTTLLKDFLALAPLPPPRRSLFRRGEAAEGAKPERRRWWLVLGLALAVAAVWWFGQPPPPDKPKLPAQPGQVVETPPTPAAGDIPRPIYVPVRPFAEQNLAPAGPAVRPPAAIAAWIVAGLGALALAGIGWTSRQRQLHLRRTRSNEAVNEHVLTAAGGQLLQAPAAPLRAATRGLRQRIAGERQVLDLEASQAATIKAGGAFSPRWRLLHHTPEYLALVDCRHPADHLTSYVEALLHALTEQGVALQVFHYEASLEFGCWRLRPGPRGNEPYDRSSLAELAARYGGQRLLVFGDCDALVHSLSGQTAAWTRQLTAFPQRAWFSPLPIASWGNPERAADGLGFLVLPAQPEAIITLAGWFASGDLSLAPAADWPFAYPELLKDDALAWVVRQTPPPPAALEELRYQLRAYLGPQRYQWLCACAIYPALAPALTLVLGRELSSDSRQLALGLAAFGALPWFRHASMPDWLRRALLDDLSPDNEARFQKAVETCLEQALEGGSGPELMRLAERRVAAWLHRGSGPARDRVMVEFLSHGRLDRLDRLARRLPEALRRRLFRHGSPAFGLRPASLAALAAGSLLAFALPWLPPLATPTPSDAGSQPRLDLIACADSAVDAATRSLADRLAAAGKAGYPQGMAVTAYTPAAWSARHAQTPPAAGEIRIAAGNAEQKTLAGALTDELRSGLNVAAQPLRVVEDASSPPPAVVANVCAAQAAPPQPVQPQVVQPNPATLLADYKVVVFVCAVAGPPANQLAKSLLPALERFGAKPVVRSIDEKGRATLAPSDRGLQIRVTRQYPDEQQAATLLLGEPEFKGSGSWRIVTTSQDSRNYLSLLVCPVDYAAGAQPPGTVPANAQPPAKSSRPAAPADLKVLGGESANQLPPISPSNSASPAQMPPKSTFPIEKTAQPPAATPRQQSLPNRNLNPIDPRQQMAPPNSPANRLGNEGASASPLEGPAQSVAPKTSEAFTPSTNPPQQSLPSQNIKTNPRPTSWPSNLIPGVASDMPVKDGARASPVETPAESFAPPTAEAFPPSTWPSKPTRGGPRAN